MAASVLCNTVRVDPEELLVSEIDNLVKQYNLTLKSITDHHAPLKTKVLRARPSAPWYSAEIDAAKRRRCKAERAWRKNKSEASFRLFNPLTPVPAVAGRAKTHPQFPEPAVTGRKKST